MTLDQAAQEEIERLKNELETERMRLAACGVIAMADTPDSAARVRSMAAVYRSDSCDNVARRVDECIELRAKLEESERQRKLLALTLERVVKESIDACAG